MLRKKPEQITSLHVYHHDAMLSAGGLKSNMGKVVKVCDAAEGGPGQALVRQAPLCWAESPVWEVFALQGSPFLWP